MVAIVGRLIAAAAGALVGAAVAKELDKPLEQREWHGEVGGAPYDFRRPSADKLKKSVWDPDNPEVITPHAFGVGWSLNFARVAEWIQPPAPQVKTVAPAELPAAPAAAIDPPRVGPEAGAGSEVKPEPKAEPELKAASKTGPEVEPAPALITPATTAAPTTPATTADPATPATTAVPATTAAPVTPATTAAPAPTSAPVTPATTAVPVTPATTAVPPPTPAAADTLATPATPAAAADTPATPTGSVDDRGDSQG